jgi:hypothetical protein
LGTGRARGECHWGHGWETGHNLSGDGQLDREAEREVTERDRRIVNARYHDLIQTYIHLVNVTGSIQYNRQNPIADPANLGNSAGFAG